MLWLFEQFPSYIRLNDIVKTHLSFNGIVRMLYTLTFLQKTLYSAQLQIYHVMSSV